MSSIRRIVQGGDQRGEVGDLGTPYRAVLDFPARRYAFSKINPVRGEQFVPDPRRVVGLPRECLLPRR